MATDAQVEVDWVVADLQTWSIEPGAWDLVAHVYLHWPTADRLLFLRAAIAGVAPGGAFVVVGHDRSNIEHGHGGPQDPDVLATPDELAALCREGGLYVAEARVVYREVTLEPGHGATGSDHEVSRAIDHVVVARRDRHTE